MSNIKLLPFKQELDNSLRARFSSTKYWDTPEKFIAMYNEGALSTTNNSVQSLAQSIVETYSNVMRTPKKFIVLSDEEVAISTIEMLLNQWQVVCALKRIAKVMIEEGYSREDNIYFANTKEGQPLVFPVSVMPDSIKIGKLSPHWSCSYRLTQNNKDIQSNMYLKNIVQIQRISDNDVLAIKIDELSRFNTSFVLELKNFVAKSAQTAR